MNDHRNDLTGEVLAYEAFTAPEARGSPRPNLQRQGRQRIRRGRRRGVRWRPKRARHRSRPARGGDRPISTCAVAGSGPALWDPVEGEDAVNTDTAPKPVGAYPHARRVGDMLYLSGVGPRQPGTNAIPGGPIHDEAGQPLDYDIKAQTQAVITNVERVLKEAGGSLEDVVDVTSFLVDMDRDFAGTTRSGRRPSARSAPPEPPSPSVRSPRPLRSR